MNSRVVFITLDQPGERLDKALAKAYPELSRSRSQQLIKGGNITINGQPVKGSFRLSGEVEVQIEIPGVQDGEIRPEDIRLDIRYEDDDLLLINKPAGMVVHPSPGHDSGTLVNAVLGYCPDLPGVGGERRPGIVHRLDKDTSGLIIVAKNESALHYLQNQFKSRAVEKRYLALVEGFFIQEKIIIEAPIGRHPVDRKKMAVIAPNQSAISRPAVTQVKVLELFQEQSYVECRPVTGRTHQIRVHLAYAKHPIVSDPVYGASRKRLNIDRMFLHAAGLKFNRPSDGKEMSFWIDLPFQLRSVLDMLRASE